MAGHSKWAKVKHFKGAIDAKRAQVFAKLSREITIAAKLGGGDAELNARLRMALLKSRGANMPAENVERAIKKGIGGEGTANFEDLTYEAFGPGGLALLIELSTDNRNRTAAEIRSLLTKKGGSIATAGAVVRLFRRYGQIVVLQESTEENRLMEMALDAGADDFRLGPDGYQILTEPAKFESVHRQLEAMGVRAAAAAVTWLPLTTVQLSGGDAVAAGELIEALEDHDDVNEVYSNAQLLS